MIVSFADLGEPAEITATEDIMATLTIDLTDDLAEEARDAGLFAPGAIEVMLRECLRRRAADGLFEEADRLARTGFPPMTMTEIQEEVNAVRSQRRRQALGA